MFLFIMSCYVPIFLYNFVITYIITYYNTAYIIYVCIIASLKNKTVWITGASSGIGEELAYVLAKAGCKLILSARRVAQLEQVKRKCLEGNDNVYVSRKFRSKYRIIRY